MRQLLTEAMRFCSFFLNLFLDLCMMLACFFILWKALMYVCGTQSQVIVVISGSMEPGVKRGDILLVHKSKEPIRAGDIVLFKIDGRYIPSVHRVIKVHERGDSGEVDILTKGDNNEVDDINLYAQGQLWLHRDDIMGNIVGYLPYVGWLTIILIENPTITLCIIAVLALHAWLDVIQTLTQHTKHTSAIPTFLEALSGFRKRNLFI